jgi:hypothetical protein
MNHIKNSMKERLKSIKSLIKYIKLPVTYTLLSFIVISFGQFLNTKNEISLIFVLIISIAYLVKVTEITRQEEELLDKIVNFALFILFASPVLIYSIVLLISISPDFYIRVGTKDAWISFSGSIISGVLVMFALVFTIQHEEKARKNEYIERLKEIALTSIPIIVPTNDINQKRSRRYVCKVINEESFELNLFTSIEIKNISNYIAKDIKITKIELSETRFLDDNPNQIVIDCTGTYSDKICLVLPQDMSHMIDFKINRIVHPDTCFELKIDVTYKDYLEQFEHSISATSMISVESVEPISRSSDFVKITFNFSEFMVNYIK